MRKLVSKGLYALGVAAAALQFCGSSALAVDTMADWTGQHNRPTDPPSVFAPDNDYGLISPTSAGGQIQSKINFHSPQQFPPENTIDTAFVYFSDPTLVDGMGSPLTLDFTTPLHMEGTITINSPEATEPNLLFGWYNSTDTRHRIGFGLSNRTVAQGGALADNLRVDFGYASTSYPNPNPPPPNLGNKFYYVSTDGNQPPESVNSVIPNGTYPFTFDFVPGTIGGSGGGSISATVGSFFKTVQPLETDPEDNDFFTFDRFGFVQRSTGNTTQLGKYNVVFSNVSYTGGTDAPVTLLGDFNSNGVVDNVDLGIWQTNMGTGTTLATGDADGDGDADGTDFLVWQQNITAPPVAAVPEPATLALVSVAAAAAGLGMRRFRR